MNYDEWNEVKKAINNKEKTKIVKVGKVYWVSVGKNIGCEIYGKGCDFVRPVLVIKTLFISGKKAFLGVPLSSKTYINDKLRFVFTDKNGVLQSALISQIRIYDNKRVINNSNIKINNDDFLNIKEVAKNELF
ncbi:MULTISPECIES: type II toxin-antitoxin system PemK/MazF family toxin [unclassified Campylobacter]|uniref:type II toxin-antitoxin system PemK/MazF family toxin n=1 Tax=unclassified Campylobacter TaxID=2593542 RepID=UPI001D85C863|nr:type II toxin-antitoxin system PemK/MazF family toxin [Campylobacter sp. RM9331]MBZ8005159.1 type II toxin-antitoxin system PemK/MazF family toxin [Campylobacter sp. RM9332]